MKIRSKVALTFHVKIADCERTSHFNRPSDPACFKLDNPKRQRGRPWKNRRQPCLADASGYLA